MDDRERIELPPNGIVTDDLDVRKRTVRTIPPRYVSAAVGAVQLLTRIPLPGGMNRPDAGPELFRASAIFYPLVGAGIGAVAGGVIWGAMQVWPPIVAVVVGLIVEAMLTGGLHEDAVADCCDAFGGGRARDDILRILKDSRIGSFGGLGLCLAVLLRIGCLTAFSPAEVFVVTIAAATIGRWGMLVMLWVVAPLGDRPGLASGLGGRLRVGEFMMATILAIPGVVACSVFDPIRSTAGIAAAAMAAVVWAVYVRRRIGGVTGDCLGFACSVGQIAFLMALTAGSGR